MATNTFRIEDTHFELQSSEITDKFVVHSTPKNYCVKFEACPIDETVNNLIDNNDILLIDRNVLDIIEDKLNFDRRRILVIDAIEDNKTIETVLDVVDFLHKFNFTKGEKLVVVGGGITQDIGSFVGSIYKRGINWKFIPTTLLSQCDSCIGGKTCVNYKNSKNQLALFSTPSEIVININFLRTLKKQEITSGLGEIMKVFIIGGPHFIELYKTHVENGTVKNYDSLKTLIVNSLHIKKKIVENDEFELSSRAGLNYGHTVGHAIEALTKYKITHGQAVSIGMRVVNDMFNFTDEAIEDCLDDLIGASERSILKTLDYRQLQNVLHSDKKTIGNAARFIYIDTLKQTRFQSMEINNELIEQIHNTVDKIVGKHAS